MSSPVVLMILDGWGLSPLTEGNALKLAATPNYDSLMTTWPHSRLTCSGEAVGLPQGQQGNSEVGHLNIGAGRVVYQDLTRINKAIKEKTFQVNPALLEAMRYCRQQGKNLHLMGLVSPGGVHSHFDHLLELVKMAKDHGLDAVYIHCFLDGRDVAPKSAEQYIQILEAHLQEIGLGSIASVSGRYYAMDRDNRWERVEQAYRVITEGTGGGLAVSAVEAIRASYRAGITDEFVVPTAIVPIEGQAAQTIGQGDGVIFFNFRSDRAREISRCFAQADFSGFARSRFLAPYFVTMTQYEQELPVQVAFPPQDLQNTLGETISKAGLSQLRLAETEKYAHVTFFFNGGVEAPYPREQRLLIPSPQVTTYDLQPEMSAYQVTEQLIKALESKGYNFLLVNFANADMVGHTGNLEAAIKAAEVVDQCLGRVIQAVRVQQGTLLITADHGNAEKMIDPETRTPFTAHTANQVPLILLSEQHYNLKSGSLQDLAPTVLYLLGEKQPQQMTGHILVEAF